MVWYMTYQSPFTFAACLPSSSTTVCRNLSGMNLVSLVYRCKMLAHVHFIGMFMIDFALQHEF